MASNETFDFAGPAGRLEAVLVHPEGPPVAAAVVCHAHPLHGGMMHFKVVYRAAKALQSAGLAVLRFNFRGVGRSEGAHDHGTGEQEDARAALFEMQGRFPGLPLVLGGFSFGSAVALGVAARDARVRAVFALGYPLLLSFRVWTSGSLVALSKETSSPEDRSSAFRGCFLAVAHRLRRPGRHETS